MKERPVRRRRGVAWLDRLEEVGRTRDRRASLPLLEALLDGGLDDEKAVEVADVLFDLEDPRCAPRLLAAVLDPSRRVIVRLAAAELYLHAPVDAPPRDHAVAWCRHHDPVLRRLGVALLDVPDLDLVAALASDPDADVRRSAVDSMCAMVRTPPLVEALRRSLADEDASVREVACRVALFDEPLEATWELLRALSDPSLGVRAAAFEALEWFPRVSVLLAVADARGGTEDTSAADETLTALVRRVLVTFSEASARARRRLERWGGPVTWLLDAEARRAARRDVRERLEAEDAKEPKRRAVDVPRAAAALLSDEAPPQVQREHLLRRAWGRSGARGRELLRACAASRNWTLRQGAAAALVETGCADELSALAFDPEPQVRRAALAAVLDGSDSCDPRILEAARDVLGDAAARPTAGDQALALIAAYGPAGEIDRVVVSELSRPDDRDGLFLGAIHLARLAGARAAVPPLLALVNAPIVGSVMPHVSALRSLRALGHPRSRIDLSHLEGVDHLDVQCELGEWDWRGPRWGTG